jgi:hypothetical protein
VPLVLLKENIMITEKWAFRQNRGNNAFEYDLLRLVGGFPSRFAKIEFSNSGTAEEHVALIAAAPDLLEACKAIHKAIGEGDPVDIANKCAGLVIPAIAKAEGK